MKIMFNCLTTRKGGAERVIDILSNSFVKNNEVTIVTNMYNENEYVFDKKIHFVSLVDKKDNSLLRKIRRVSPILLLRLKKVILKNKPDVIISFLPEANFRLLFLKKYCKVIKNIPVIISVRNDPETEYKKRIHFYIMRKLYPLANQLVLQTEDSKKYFINNINYSGVVIPNPVDKVFLAERYLGDREKRIVAVGRLERQKNYFNMIDAFDIFYKKHSEYMLEIYGDGTLKVKLQDYINEKHLENKIFLRGKTDNIKDKLYKASLFVMSSDHEGMPNALLEAVCLGVPCISTDCPCGGPREILNGGEYGYLVPVNDSRELANGMCKMVENQNMASDFSIKSNNSRFIYSIERVVKQWKMVIKMVR